MNFLLPKDFYGMNCSGNVSYVKVGEYFVVEQYYLTQNTSRSGKPDVIQSSSSIQGVGTISCEKNCNLLEFKYEEYNGSKKGICIVLPVFAIISLLVFITTMKVAAIVCCAISIIAVLIQINNFRELANRLNKTIARIIDGFE